MLTDDSRRSFLRNNALSTVKDAYSPSKLQSEASKLFEAWINYSEAARNRKKISFVEKPRHNSTISKVRFVVPEVEVSRESRRKLQIFYIKSHKCHHAAMSTSNNIILYIYVFSYSQERPKI